MKISVITKENIKLNKIFNINSQVRQDNESFILFEYSKSIQVFKGMKALSSSIHKKLYKFKFPFDGDYSKEAMLEHFQSKEYPFSRVTVSDSLFGYDIHIDSLNSEELGESKLVLTSYGGEAYKSICKHDYFKGAEYCSSKSKLIVDKYLLRENGGIYFLNSGIGKSEFELYKWLSEFHPERIRILKNGIVPGHIYLSNDILDIDIFPINNFSIGSSSKLFLQKKFFEDNLCHPYPIGGTPPEKALKKQFGNKSKSVVILDKPVFNDEIESYIIKKFGVKYSDESWVEYINTSVIDYKKQGCSVYIKLHPFSSKDAELRFNGEKFLNRQQNLRKVFDCQPVVFGWGSKELLFALARGCVTFSLISNGHILNEYLNEEREIDKRILTELNGVGKIFSMYYKALPVKMNVRLIENFQRTCEVVNG